MSSRRVERVSTSSSKKYCTSVDAGRDRISNLPDGVLSQILSCLPIKDATRTCVLSKHWEFKWNLICDVKLKDLSPGLYEDPNFVNIVERILVHLHVIRSLDLVLSCHQAHDKGRMESLISALLRGNIERLELSIDVPPDRDLFVVPRSLLNCTSLITLALRMECFFKLPVRTCFPHLRSLYLCDVEIVNDISNTDTLILTLPVLETFTLYECKWLKVKFVEIEAPLLTTFSSTAPEVKINYSIKIIGARLDFLKVSGGYPENIVLSGTTVVQAEIECIHIVIPGLLSLEECGFQVRKLLRQLPNLKYLDISDVLMAIGRTKLGLPLPRFRKLQELCIRDCSNAEGLLCLLHAAPHLKFLETPGYGFDYDYESAESLPACILHHLKKATFHYPSRRIPENEFYLEKFLLKYGRKLKTIVLSYLGDKNSEIADLLLTFPRASTCLRIVEL